MPNHRFWSIVVVISLFWAGNGLAGVNTLGVAKNAEIQGRQVQLDFYLENFDTGALTGLSLVDDLDATFGAGTYGITSPPSFVQNPGSITLNASFNGAGDTQLISSGTLGGLQTAQIRVVVELDDLSGGPVFYNTATCFATESGTDDSVDGTNPDPNGDNDPSESGPTIIDFGAIPKIGIAKSATLSGTQVTFDYFIENLGNRDLNNLSLPDDLDAVFGVGNYSIFNPPSLISGPMSLVANGSFDGSADPNLLTTSSLAIGAMAQIRVVVDVNTVTDRGMGFGVYSNQVTVSGTSVSPPFMESSFNQKAQASDLSDNGYDPDPNGNGLANDPGEDDPTLFVIGEEPAIGLAKTASVFSNSTVIFDFYLENLGNTNLSQIDLIDNLATTFGTDTFSLIAPPQLISGTVTVNPNFNGTSDPHLLNPSSLATGQTAHLQLNVKVQSISDQGLGFGNYANNAQATGLAPGGGLCFDFSDDGVDPDPNGNNNANEVGENDATPFTITEFSSVGVAKSVLVLGTRTLNINNNGVNGNATGQHVRFLFTIENLGNTTINSLTLPDDLVPVFGNGNFGKINSAGFPEVRLNPGTVSTNSAYNGSTNTEMLNPASSLAPGRQAQIVCEFLIVNIVDVGMGVGVYSNQVTFQGTNGSGTVSDLSDNGLIPDPNGNGIADESGENDPTLFNLGSYLGAAKTASIMGNQVTFELYLENFGATNYSQISLVDDFGNVFGEGNYTLNTISLIDDPGTFILNPNFDGSSDAQLLDPTSTLAAGDTAQIEMVVTVLKLKNRGAGLGIYSNQVTVAGAQPGGYISTDLSDNGTDPDPDGDGNPNESSENDPTPFNMATDAIVGAALSATVDTGVTTLRINLEAFGSVTSSQISLDASLDTVFGAGNYTLLSTTLVDDPGTLTLDPAFDGSSNLALIGAGSTLATGDTAGIEIQVQNDIIVDLGFGTGRYSMQVTVNCIDSRGIIICDLSDSGTNPDPSSNNDPTTIDEDDPTLFNVNGAALGLARRATVQGNLITFDLFIENLGGTTMPNFAINESLLSVFGFGNFTMSSAPTLIVNPGTVLVNNSYDGLFSPSLVISGSSLAPGARAQVRYIVNVTNVTNQGNGFGVYLTQSSVSTIDSEGNNLSDLSDDGILSDPNGNGEPNEVGENDITTAIIGEQPITGAAKQVAVNLNELTIDLTIENLGNVSLSQVSLSENLDDLLGAGNYTITTAPFFTDDPGTLTLNGSYDGGSDPELFSAGTFGVGDTAAIEMVVNVDHVINGGHYSNQVIAAGEGPSGTYYADYSDNGSDPDPNGDGEPGDLGEDDPSPFDLTSLSAGIAKQASVVADQVTFNYTLENLGTQGITNVHVVEDLDSVFGAGNYSIISGPTLISAPRALTINPNFNGSSDLELVNGNIATGLEQIQLVLRVFPIVDMGSGYGVYSNQVLMTADDGVSDLSDNGTDPDPNGNGAADDAGEDDPTPVIIAQRTVIGAALTASVSAAQVTLDIYLENLGNVTLSTLSVNENLETLFGVGNFSIASGPSFSDDPGTLTLNPLYDGGSNDSLVSAGTLAPGDTAAIRLVVNLLKIIDSGSGMGLYSHQLTVGAIGPGPIATNDLSDNGTDPDPNGNNIPSDSGENDPTLFTVQAATIGDFVWNDLDGDGVQDAGEPGMAGALVYADFNNNGVQDGIEPSDTTDGTGAYAINCLIAGTYNMRVEAATVTSGFVRTTAADPVPISVATGATNNTADFGYQQQDAAIGDFVWNDLNGDGVQDGGEPGIPGVTVFFDLNTNGSRDGGEPFTTSDGSGAYLFSALPTGTYTVTVDATSLPSGFVLTGGTSPAIVNLAAGEIYTTADFGYQQQDASIGDFVWNDLNGNGVQDGGEPGLPGIVVFLDLNINGTLDGGEPSTTSDAAGAYDFTNLPTGTYTPTIDASTVPSGFVLTTGMTAYTVNLAAGEDFNTADFGFQQQDASIGDFVWNDLNGNGAQDGGEPGLAGIVVFFDLNTNGTLDGGEPNATTDGAGAYDFTNLPSGTYSVQLDPSTIPTGFGVTAGIGGFNVSLAAGEDYNNADFGLQQQDASIGDFVWNDLNGDGVQDGGELGLPGVTVFLDLNTNGTLDGGEPSATTDAAGAYDLTNLGTGLYAVTVDTTTLPTGFALTGGMSPLSVSLAAGEDYNNADFGYQQQDASIGDFVWNDLDGDGLQDGGEPGLVGIVVFLDLNINGTLDGGEPSITSDAAGAYDFTNLAPGTYTPTLDASTVPSGFVLTTGPSAYTVNLAAGEDYNLADFGFQQQDASIGDFVWNDLNGNGTQDGGEPGLSGVSLFLDLNLNGTLDGGEPSTSTDGAGAFQFTNLAAGTYRVVVDPTSVPSGFVLTTANQPLDVTLTPGQNDTSADFGYQQQNASIGDFVWDDYNSDGIQDVGEPGLAGIVVFNDANMNGTPDGGELSTTTDGLGAYGFANLPTGTYTIQIDSSSLPSGYLVTTGNLPLTINLAAGETYTTADFGFCMGPTITQQPVGQSICPFQGFTLTIAATGTPTLTYQWRRNGMDLPGETNTTLLINLTQDDIIATYSCLVSNGCGSVLSDEVVVTPIPILNGLSAVTGPTNTIYLDIDSNCDVVVDAYWIQSDGTTGLAKSGIHLVPGVITEAVPFVPDARYFLDIPGGDVEALQNFYTQLQTVPTLDEWKLILFLSLIMATALGLLRKHRKPAQR